MDMYIVYEKVDFGLFGKIQQTESPLRDINNVEGINNLTGKKTNLLWGNYLHLIEM